VFGLEVSYFAGEVEAFVPRLVVRPTIGGRIAAAGSSTRQPADPETYIMARPEAVQEAIRAFTDEIGDLGGELDWMPYGPRVRIRGKSGPRVMASLDQDRLWIAVGARKGLNPEPGVRAAEQLSEIPSGQIRDDWGSVEWDADPQQVEAGLRIARELVHDQTQKAVPG
jgi:hypothetical protein